MKLKTLTTAVLPLLCSCKNLALHIQGKASESAKDPAGETKEFENFANFIKSELEEKEYSVGVVKQTQRFLVRDLEHADLKEIASKVKTDDPKNSQYTIAREDLAEAGRKAGTDDPMNSKFTFNYPNKLLLSYDCHGNEDLQCGLTVDQFIEFLYHAKYAWYHADSIAIVANGCHSKDFWNTVMKKLEKNKGGLKLSWAVTSSCEAKNSWFRTDYQATPWHQFFSGKYTDLEHKKLSERKPFLDWKSSQAFMIYHNFVYQWKVEELAELAGGECLKDSSCHKVHFLKSTKNPLKEYLNASDWNLQPRFLSSQYTSNISHFGNKLDCWKVESKIKRILSLYPKYHKTGNIPTVKLIQKFLN